MSQLSLLVSADQGLVRLPLPSRRRVTLGRAATCDIVLDDDSVSRQHARLHLGARTMIEDLGSSNGTQILGQRLRSGERAALPMGAAFDLAGTTLLVQDRRRIPAPTRTRARPRKGAPVIADPLMLRLYALLDVLGPSDLDVLILGDTGTGKRTYADTLVARSARAKKPIVEVDSGTLDKSTLMAALDKAEDGTIVFDRIDELPLSLHAKVLGSRRFESRRVFTATASGTKLALRMGGFAVRVPPLRGRRDDIVPLARFFAERSAKQLDEPVPELSEQAANALTRHEWPRNVGELQGVIERAVLDADGAQWIDLEHLRLSRYEA